MGLGNRGRAPSPVRAFLSPSPDEESAHDNFAEQVEQQEPAQTMESQTPEAALKPKPVVQKRVEVHLPSPLHEALRLYCFEQNKTFTVTLRTALERFLTSEKKKQERRNMQGTTC